MTGSDIHTYVYTHIPWIHKFVIETAECETNHKYAHIQNFYSVEEN